MRDLSPDSLDHAAAVVIFAERNRPPAADRFGERVLLPWALARLGRTPVATFRVAHGPRGRPYLAGRDGAAIGPSFNISHSGRLIALALSERATVGVDIQREPDGQWVRIARRWLHATENLRIATAAEPCRVALFTQLWAVREARCKSTGLGLADFRTDDALPVAAAGVWAGVEWTVIPVRRGHAGALAWCGRPSRLAGESPVVVCWPDLADRNGPGIR